MTDEKREIRGRWWFADKPDDRWLGTLTLRHEQSPSLKVTVPKGFFKCENQKMPSVIHGHDEHGVLVTLFFVSPPTLHQAFALTEMRFTAGYAILGIDFPTVEDFQVQSLTIRMQHLFEWVGISGFKRENSNKLHDFQICYSRPEDQCFVINSDLSLELRSAYSGNHNWQGRKFEEDLIIAFQSKEGFGLKDAIELVDALRQLLHFAVLDRVYPTTVSAFKDGHGEMYGERFIEREIELVGSFNRKRIESEFFHERWVFQFKDVQNDFGGFMAKWLEYLGKFDEALHNYFATIYHRLPHSIEHLCLTQALDAYHGIKFVSHDERGYEKKVKELVEGHRAPLKGLIDDPADFATTVLHNRNYYTHHNPKWKKDGRVLSGSALYRLNEKLRLVFQMCVLADMGIPADRFIRLRRQLATQIIDYV